MLFYYCIIKVNDFNVSLMKNVYGDFIVLFDIYVDGVYIVFIEFIDNSWKLKEDIIFFIDKIILISFEYK